MNAVASSSLSGRNWSNTFCTNRDAALSLMPVARALSFSPGLNVASFSAAAACSASNRSGIGLRCLVAQRSATSMARPTAAGIVIAASSRPPSRRACRRWAICTEPGLASAKSIRSPPDSIRASSMLRSAPRAPTIRATSPLNQSHALRACWRFGGAGMPASHCWKSPSVMP